MANAHLALLRPVSRLHNHQYDTYHICFSVYDSYNIVSLLHARSNTTAAHLFSDHRKLKTGYEFSEANRSTSRYVMECCFTQQV